MNNLRDLLFERCGEAAELKEGLFTLTAPTGTGKTLALLHFALRHAARYRKKRIILEIHNCVYANHNFMKPPRGA